MSERCQLKSEMELYIFFWEEWTRNPDCNLTKLDIEIINLYLRTRSESQVEKSNELCNLVDMPTLVKKLRTGYRTFKASVVLNFLCQLVKLAREYFDGYNSFLESPIYDLKIPAQLALCLLSFKVHNIRLLVTVFNEEDFIEGLIYQKIVEFQILCKNQKINEISEKRAVNRPFYVRQTSYF